jgi:hypothetical protein
VVSRFAGSKVIFTNNCYYKKWHAANFLSRRSPFVDLAGASIAAPPIHEVRERLAAFVSLDLAGDEGGDRFAQR